MMIDKGLHRFEERRTKSRFMGAAGGSGDEIHITFPSAAALLVPGERPRGPFSLGVTITVAWFTEVRLALEDRRDRLHAFTKLLEITPKTVRIRPGARGVLLPFLDMKAHLDARQQHGLGS